MSDKLEPCYRCGEDFESRELNDVGLCPPCVEDEEGAPAKGRDLARELREMSNQPLRKRKLKINLAQSKLIGYSFKQSSPQWLAR